MKAILIAAPAEPLLFACVSACLRSGITQRRTRLMLIALLFVLLGTLRRKALHFTGVLKPATAAPGLKVERQRRVQISLKIDSGLHEV